MYQVKKLKGHSSAQCKVALTANSITLISYTTAIIKAERFDGGYIVTCSGLYSMTTRKHISWFIQEYFPALNFQEIKSIAGLDKHIYIDRYNNATIV